jgi:hypothetical protein
MQPFGGEGLSGTGQRRVDRTRCCAMQSSGRCRNIMAQGGDPALLNL